MRKILTIAGAALAISCVTATAPAKAQAVFESAYTQPTEMVDGINVGARITRAAHYGAETGVAAQRCTRGNCGRRAGAR